MTVRAKWMVGMLAGLAGWGGLYGAWSSWRAHLEPPPSAQARPIRESPTLSAPERRARFAELGPAMMDRRNLERLKNSTPEQRVEQHRRMIDARRRLQHMHPPHRRPPPEPHEPISLSESDGFGTGEPRCP